MSAICGTLVRPTNVIILVICILAFLIFAPGDRRRADASVKAGVLLVLAIVSLLGNGYIFGASRSTSEDPTIVFDLAGVSTHTHIDMFAKLANGDILPPDRPWECYSPKRADPFFWNKCREYSGFVERHQNALHSLWIKAILQHPLAYLAHRWQFAKQLLVSDEPQTIVPPPPQFYFPTINYGQFTKLVPEKMTRQIQMWNPTIAYSPFGLVAYTIFRSWLGQPLLWVGILIAGVIIAYFQHRRGEALLPILLATLGLSNVIIMIFVSPADEVRYLLPTWLCAVGAVTYLAVIVLRSVCVKWTPQTGPMGSPRDRR